MLFVTLIANAKKTNASYWNKVIDAISQVESKGNPSAVSKDCVGILQIRPVLVNDVNEYLKMKKSSKRFKLNDRLSAEKSKEMFVLYQERYNPTSSVEKAIKIWNGGPYYDKSQINKVNAYYRKVMKYYNGGK